MRSRAGEGGLFGFPPAVTQIVLLTIIVFLLQSFIPEGMLYRLPGGMRVSMAPNGFALVPSQVLTRGMVWELVTYIFLHGGFMHIAFNMFYLLMFGSNLERYWGSRAFTKYYLITGAGAGVIQVLATYIFGGNPYIPVVGASGAVFGLLIAYAMAFPHHQVLLWFVVPVSVRTLVIFLGLLNLFFAFEYGGGDNVARFAHLGGMLVGYLYLRQETLTWRIRRWWGQTRKSVGSHRHPPSTDTDPQLQEKIDEILEKIQEKGMGSLTEEERRLLHESAERARRRQQGRDK